MAVSCRQGEGEALSFHNISRIDLFDIRVFCTSYKPLSLHTQFLLQNMSFDVLAFKHDKSDKI